MPAAAARRPIIASAFAWGQGGAGQQAGAAADGAKQRPFGIFGERRALDVGGAVSFGYAGLTRCAASVCTNLP